MEEQGMTRLETPGLDPDPSLVSRKVICYGVLGTQVNAEKTPPTLRPGLAVVPLTGRQRKE